MGYGKLKPPSSAPASASKPSGYPRTITFGASHSKRTLKALKLKSQSKKSGRL